MGAGQTVHAQVLVGLALGACITKLVTTNAISMLKTGSYTHSAVSEGLIRHDGARRVNCSCTSQGRPDSTATKSLGSLVECRSWCLRNFLTGCCEYLPRAGLPGQCTYHALGRIDADSCGPAGLPASSNDASVVILPAGSLPWAQRREADRRLLDADADANHAHLVEYADAVDQCFRTLKRGCHDVSEQCLQP